MKQWLFIIVCILVFGLALAFQQIDSTQKKWKIAEANVKAYSSMLENTKNQNTALQLTIDQFKYFQDSVLKVLDNTRKEMNIKSKDVKALQYIETALVKSDTIALKDTVFKSQEVAIDTTIGDKWYNVKVGLRYPSSIAVSPSFRSEKHIIVSTRKETVNPPKKLFFLRWFQKKHRVLQVDVVERNPYVEDQTSRYVEIIGK